MSQLGYQKFSGSQSWRARRRFEEYARFLIRLPGPGDGPLDHLLSESEWRARFPPGKKTELQLMALSQATGVYFFPSREWVSIWLRWLQKLQIRRVLEAGAGRGYLAAALQPLLTAAGIAFKAIDRREGEFVHHLPPHPIVQQGDVFSEVWRFRPQVVLYAWPPPGQSLAAICRCPFVRYLVVVGEKGGGCTGAASDWQQLRHRHSPLLSRYGVGRTGRDRQTVTIFYGAESF